ncbi:hypothetical protein BS78_05G173500 [Paspalum vaginatum]|nr:hypothetical protein BS78_05G173500 [Paspalum vaginatum]
MDSGKRAAGVVALVAILILVAAPTSMARSLQVQEDTSPVLRLNTIAREFARTVGGSSYCYETCAVTVCTYSALFGCTCQDNICMK